MHRVFQCPPMMLPAYARRGPCQWGADTVKTTLQTPTAGWQWQGATRQPVSQPLHVANLDTLVHCRHLLTKFDFGIAQVRRLLAAVAHGDERSRHRGLNPRSWGASMCAIRHLGPTMTACVVVPFTRVFFVFLRGKFHFGAKFMLVPTRLPPSFSTCHPYPFTRTMP